MERVEEVSAVGAEDRAGGEAPEIADENLSCGVGGGAGDVPEGSTTRADLSETPARSQSQNVRRTCRTCQTCLTCLTCLTCRRICHLTCRRRCGSGRGQSRETDCPDGQSGRQLGRQQRSQVSWPVKNHHHGRKNRAWVCGRGNGDVKSRGGRNRHHPHCGRSYRPHGGKIRHCQSGMHHQRGGEKKQNQRLAPRSARRHHVPLPAWLHWQHRGRGQPACRVRGRTGPGPLE